MSEFQRILEDIDDYKNDIKECQEEITKTVKFLSEETDYLLLDDYLSPLTKLHTKLVQLKRDLMHSINCLNKLEGKTTISYEQFKKDNGIIGTYTIDSKGLCNVIGNVDLTFRNSTEIPIPFGIVSGNFRCSYNNLTNLKNSPKEVGGGFLCENNHLTTLKYAPEKVGRAFTCAYNQLTTLEGAPEEVGDWFDCDSNKLTSLKGATKRVGGSFYCRNNQLTTLEGAPMMVGGGFHCGDNIVEFRVRQVQNVCCVVGNILVEVE